LDDARALTRVEGHDVIRCEESSLTAFGKPPTGTPFEPFASMLWPSSGMLSTIRKDKPGALRDHVHTLPEIVRQYSRTCSYLSSHSAQRDRATLDHMAKIT
jgi:hypothetical protein